MALLVVTVMMISNAVGIDFEWAESLKGLPMSVPEHWWPGYSGLKTYAGTITSIDRDADNGRFFCLSVADEPGAIYPMRYGAVFKYVDEKHKLFGKFNLPHVALADPSGDLPVSVPPHHARLSSQPIFSSPPSVPRSQSKRRRREPQ